MNLEQFSEQVRQAQERANRLSAEVQGTYRDDLMPQVLEDLGTALEELRAADEELRARNSELEQIHQWAEQERRYYRELFDAAPDAYLVTDTHGIIQDVNRSAAVMFQSPQRFLIGKPIALLVADSELRTFRNRLSQLRHRGAPETEAWDIAMQSRRGAPVNVSAHISTARDWRGLPVGLRWVLRERSQPVHAQQMADLQQHMNQQTAQLAALAQRHTEEQHQRQIMQAQLDALQETLRMREALMSNAAHELRNCITPIYGYADYFQHIGEHLSSNHERVQRGLRIMAQQGLRIEQLVVSLLEWPQLEQRQAPGPPEQLDCVALVSATVDQMRRALVGTQIQLSSAPPELLVAANRQHLEETLRTLIQEAVRRSVGASSVKLQVAQEERWAVISLYDQGPPVAETVVQALQLREAALQAIDVLGVGLAIACVVIGRQGGQLSAAHDQALGNLFNIRLPLHSYDVI